MTDNRTDRVVAMARDALADASNDTTTLTRQELGGMIGRLAGTMQGLLEYIDLLHERAELTQQIAQHEQAARETQARIDAGPLGGTR